jgi:nucleotide-binding universal stress UspA family protein
MRAVRWGAAEATRRTTPLRLVLGFAWPYEALRPGGQEEMHRDVLLTAAREQLGLAAAAVRDEPGLDVQQQLIVGSPIPVLAQEARRAQLLVLSDRGLGQVEGCWSGRWPGRGGADTCSAVRRVGGDVPRGRRRALCDRRQPGPRPARAGGRGAAGRRGVPGSGAFASMVLGSVGNVLLHRSPCPVAVVRPEGSR